MLSTEVACYAWCTPASLSIHQLHYLHATLSVVNVRILCKQPEAFSQHSVVAKRCRVTHYGYTTSIPPWLHYITLDFLFFSMRRWVFWGLHTGCSLLNAFQITLFLIDQAKSVVTLHSTASLMGKMFSVVSQHKLPIIQSIASVHLYRKKTLLSTKWASAWGRQWL